MHINGASAASYTAMSQVATYSSVKPVYPKNLSSIDIDYKINALENMDVLAGPNCWGTIAFILGITPSLRYISEIEFNDFVKQSHIINYNNGQVLPDGAVLCVWNNQRGFVAYNHVSLVIDGRQDKLYEKSGPNKDDKLKFSSLAEILSEAESLTCSKINIVNSLEQKSPGKYVTLLDFSEVNSSQGSELEDLLFTYHMEGNIINKTSVLHMLDVYRREITKITNPRELSLSEGVFYLLQSMNSELNELQQEYLSTKDKTLAKKLMGYSSLRAIIDNEIINIVSNTQEYRRSLNPQVINAPTLTDYDSQLTKK